MWMLWKAYFKFIKQLLGQKTACGKKCGKFGYPQIHTRPLLGFPLVEKAHLFG